MNTRLRVLFFGSGGALSLACLRALARDHDIVGFICPHRGSPRRGVRAWVDRATSGVGLPMFSRTAVRAYRHGARFWPVPSSRELPAVLRAAGEADLVCVSGFPWKIPEATLAAASLGGINLHTSLLPRHRGPLTLFWVYHADDRDTGVTVHQMTGDFDSGDILRQHAFPLDRGYPVDALNARHVEIGPELLRQCAQDLAHRRATLRRQDEQLATYAPLVRPGDRMVDFETWDAERVWHFLAGLYPRFIEPITDADGPTVTYSGVIGHERGLDRAPLGSVRRQKDQLMLQCRDGVVFLRAAQ